MKKIYFLFLSLACLCSLTAFADSPCDNEMPMKPKTSCAVPCQKPCAKPCEKPCEKQVVKPCETKYPQTYKHCTSECFLCTNVNMNNLFRQMNLSETQICTAMKIQEKYELEVLSLNERIQCEEQKYESLNNNCSKWSERHKQKRLVKDLKKKRKEICKCYEKQFRAILSDSQWKAYKKYKKS